MNYRLLWGTLKHLRPTQVFFQVYYRLHKPVYQAMAAPQDGERAAACGFKTEPIARWRCWLPTIGTAEDAPQADRQQHFCFLNIAAPFTTWNETSHGMLWAYNQNYMDWLNQEGIGKEDCCFWIDKFTEELPQNRIGLDPYPIALRSINWVKVMMRWPDCATRERRDSLYSQLRLLEKKLEYHLLANHLLEDAYALYIGAAYFADRRLLKKAKRLLEGQLKEQILKDGAHYEQSPMYHCILLDRLLDAINIGERCAVNGVELRKYAKRMVGWLKSMTYSDGSFPLLNDAAEGIAPKPRDIIDYARRLGIESEATELGESGYRKLANGRMEAFVDVGNITATYQPGHTHADSLNYELRIDGKPFVVDTGISTYNKNERRQLERSSKAHNVVVAEGKDSSEVWGGFRVGRRAKVFLELESPRIDHKSPLMISAEHDGYDKPVKRRLEMSDGVFVVEDWYDGEAVSYIHLAEGIKPERIQVEGVTAIDIKPWKYSTEYNRFHDGTVIEIKFDKYLKYTIR